MRNLKYDIIMVCIIFKYVYFSVYQNMYSLSKKKVTFQEAKD